MDRELHRLFNAMWVNLRQDRLCAPIILSFRKRRVHPEALISRLCWFVFLDRPSTFERFTLEKLASKVGHDWRSLKRLPQRLEKFLQEKKRLEAAARRPLDYFLRQGKKLAKETGQIEPLPVLAPGLLSDSIPGTLEHRSRLLNEALPHARSFLARSRDARVSEALDVMGWLRRERLSYPSIAALLNGVACALGTENEVGEYDADALRMRFRRAQRL